MTFAQYILAAARRLQTRPEERIGQAFFNELVLVRPDLDESVRATNIDPFYFDGRLPVFLEYVESRWKRI